MEVQVLSPAPLTTNNNRLSAAKTVVLLFVCGAEPTQPSECCSVIVYTSLDKELIIVIHSTMKIWLVLIICLLVSACKSSHSPTQPSDALSINSKLSITRIEAKNTVASMKNRKDLELSSCIESELFKLGQKELFKTYLLNGNKCKTYQEARHDAIMFFKDDAVRICKNLPPPLYSLECWNGTFIDPYDPCSKCPPYPKETNPSP